MQDLYKTDVFDERFLFTVWNRSIGGWVPEGAAQGGAGGTLAL